MWRKYYHSSIIAYYAIIGIYTLKIFIFESESILFKHLENYISTWVMMIQTTYFLATSGCYLMQCENKFIERCFSVILTSVIFPLAIFTSVTFWILYIWNREQNFFENFDTVIPAVLNHIVHTNVALLAVMEYLVKPQIVYPSRKIGLGVLYLVLILYTIWLHAIYFQTQRWVYRFLNNQNLLFAVLLSIYSFVFVFFAYVLGEKFNSLIRSTFYVKENIKEK